MTFFRLSAGRPGFVRGALATGLLLATCALAVAADQFPFDQELVLDAARMRPAARRVPILSVAPDGRATIDLWCKTVSGRVAFADMAIKIETDPLPEALPQMMIDGQCTPPRMQADQDLLAALAQVTAWRRQGSALVLDGPTVLKFRLNDH